METKLKEQKMIKRKVAVVLGLSMACLLAACSANPSEDGAKSEAIAGSDSANSEVVEEEFDPNKKVEITFWHTLSKSKAQPILDSIIEEFNKIYPNITVTNTQQGGYDELNEAINNNISTGNLPTMAYCYEDHVAGYIDHNAVLDMTPYINDATYGLGKNPTGYDLGDKGVDDMVAGYWSAGSKYAVSGTYSLPWSKSTEALFYNKTVFDSKGWSAPTTWDELWELCATIKADPDYSSSEKYCLGWDSDANLLITSFAQKDLPYTTATPEGNNSHFTFNTPENRALVSELKTYYDKQYFLTKGTTANSSYTSTLFTAGTVLMTVSSTGGTTYCYDANFETGVTGIPQYDLNDRKMISQGPSITFFKKGSTKAQRTAAWLFYKFATNSLNSALFAKAQGYNPVRNSSYDTAPFADMDVWADENGLVGKVYSYISDEDNGYTTGQFTSPAFKGSSTGRNEMDGLLPSVLLGTKTVEKAFDDAMSNCLFAE